MQQESSGGLIIVSIAPADPEGCREGEEGVGVNSLLDP